MTHLKFRLPSRDESGLAMITVIGIATILFAVATTMFVQTMTNLGMATQEESFEQSIQVADAGVEEALFQLNKLETWNTGETLPASFASRAAERTWAETAASTAATNSPSTRLKTTPEGQYVIVKPSNSTSVIYAVGYVPNFTASAATREARVIRATYAMGPLPSKFAILTRGDLTLGPSHTSIKGGSVHANGDLTVTGNGKIDGFVTSSGDFTNANPTKLKFGDAINSGGGRPPVDVPLIKPIDYYGNSHYDLCPDGTVKPGPKFPGTPKNTTLTPCNPALTSLPYNNKTGYRGWFYRGTVGTHGAVWEFESKKGYDGVYYIKDGSAHISAKKIEKWNVTILASATGADCALTGGDIIMRNGKVGTGEGSKNKHWNPHPDSPGMLMVAGRDFDHGNAYANVLSGDFVNGFAHSHDLNGIIYAYEQFRNGKKHLETQGSLISYGAPGCNSAGSPVSTNVSGHPHVEWAGTLTVPTDRVRILAWEEM